MDETNDEKEVVDSDEDKDLFDDDADLRLLREKRLAKMKAKFEKRKEYLAKGHGKYEEIVEEQFLKVVTSSRYCVVAWYHKDFERCKIVDMHLKKLCKQEHLLETRFVRIDAEKARFFVGKLKIRTLPTSVLFINGVAVDKIVGFNDFGGDEFTTEMYEKRLWQGGVIKNKEGYRVKNDEYNY